MCTAITWNTTEHYFGRTLDYTRSFGEEIVVTPRNYPFYFRHMGERKTHFAMIGTAFVSNGYPLYYDAVNEKGLCMAGLNFPGNAVYLDPVSGKENVAQFELLPWILGQCDSVDAAKEHLRRLHITSDNFAEGLPAAELHWIIADSHQAVTVEAVREGLHIYENPVGVLTNNPPFPMQMFALNNYMHLTPEEPQNHLAKELPLCPYSLGLGALGLPGDLSSQSRFVRAAFTKLNATAGSTEEENVNQFFHILGTVQQTEGCCRTVDGDCEKTIYTSCCNADKGIYYYTTYGCHQITAVQLRQTELDAEELSRWSMQHAENIYYI